MNKEIFQILTDIISIVHIIAMIYFLRKEK